MSSVDTSDFTKILIIAIGLIAFTYMIWVSRSKKKTLSDKRRRIKDQWRRRFEDDE